MTAINKSKLGASSSNFLPFCIEGGLCDNSLWFLGLSPMFFELFRPLINVYILDLAREVARNCAKFEYIAPR